MNLTMKDPKKNRKGPMKVPGLRDRIQGAMKEALKKGIGVMGRTMKKKNNSIGLKQNLVRDIVGQQDQTGQGPFGRKANA